MVFSAKKMDLELQCINLEIDSCTDKVRIRCEKLIKVCIAGPCAQRIFNPSGFRHRDARSDYEHATDMLSRITRGNQEEMSAYWKLLKIQTQGFLELQWKMVGLVAEALLEQEELSRKQVQQLMFDYVP